MTVMKQIFFSTLLTVSLLFGCATTPGKVGGFNLVSVDEEKQLGDKFATEIEKQKKVVTDPEVQAYIDRLGKKLLTGARQVDFPYTFKVVKDDTINAFAVPGGHTYVNTGLIKAAQTENELAGVMAHEINHVVARHSTQQMTKQYGYELVAGLLLGQNQSQLTKLAADMFGQAGLLYYSREMEHEADVLGVETMYKAGYNPQGMATFFEKLQAEQKVNPGKLAQFFSSHPQTADRIQKVRDEAAKFPPKNFNGSSAEFERIKAKVKGM